MNTNESKKRAHVADNQVGATTLEAALVLGLFLFSVLFFIDCSRYFLARALLINGTQEAVDLASRIPDFDIDTTTVAVASPEAAKFLAARDAVRNAAFRAGGAGVIVAPPASGGWTELSQFSIFDQFSDADVPNQPSGVLILRPGESHQRAGSWIHHPQRCSAATYQTDTGCTKRTPSETTESLMRNLPIMVRMEATMRTILPFLGPWTVQATSLSWREQAARSGFRDAGFTSLPLTASSPTPIPTQSPLPCVTTSWGRCGALGMCEWFCSTASCCYCTACGGN